MIRNCTPFRGWAPPLAETGGFWDQVADAGLIGGLAMTVKVDYCTSGKIASARWRRLRNDGGFKILFFGASNQITDHKPCRLKIKV